MKFDYSRKPVDTSEYIDSSIYSKPSASKSDGLGDIFGNLFDSRPSWLTKAGTYTGTDGSVTNLTAPEFNAIKSSGVTEGLEEGGLSSLVSDPNSALSGIGGIKGLGTIAGIGADVYGIMNQKKGLKQAEKAWEKKNARANEIMAMKREQYDTFKKDKAALNAGYSGASKVG